MEKKVLHQYSGASNTKRGSEDTAKAIFRTLGSEFPLKRGIRKAGIRKRELKSMKSTVLLYLAQSMAVVASPTLQPKDKLIRHNVNLRNPSTQLAIQAAVMNTDDDDEELESSASKKPVLTRIVNVKSIPRSEEKDDDDDDAEAISTKTPVLTRTGNIKTIPRRKE